MQDKSDGKGVIDIAADIRIQKNGNRPGRRGGMQAERTRKQRNEREKV
jgi:hypothetical protein